MSRLWSYLWSPILIYLKTHGTLQYCTIKKYSVIFEHSFQCYNCWDLNLGLNYNDLHITCKYDFFLSHSIRDRSTKMKAQTRASPERMKEGRDQSSILRIFWILVFLTLSYCINHKYLGESQKPALKQAATQTMTIAAGCGGWFLSFQFETFSFCLTVMQENSFEIVCESEKSITGNSNVLSFLGCGHQFGFSHSFRIVFKETVSSQAVKWFLDSACVAVCMCNTSLPVQKAPTTFDNNTRFYHIVTSNAPTLPEQLNKNSWDTFFPKLLLLLRLKSFCDQSAHFGY